MWVFYVQRFMLCGYNCWNCYFEIYLKKRKLGKQLMWLEGLKINNFIIINADKLKWKNWVSFWETILFY